MPEDKQPLVVIAGPTASGKSGLSLRLAEAIGGSIISADSMQVYKALDIGSAKLSYEERRGIPHYLIDVLEPDAPFDVAQFQQMAESAIRTIHASGRLPILTGGTGFYIQAVVRQINFSESTGASAARSRWEQLAREEGAEALHRRLAAIDPEAAAAIHPHNIRRVVRALEYHAQTGEQISAHNRRQRARTSPYRLFYFVLTGDRQRLYAQIDRRVDEMLAQGLVQEVRALYDRGLTEAHSSMKAIGYKEFFPYFRGECTLEEAAERIKRNTRHYAKRQLTWFRREPDAIWIDQEAFGCSEDAVLAFMLDTLRASGIPSAHSQTTHT